MATPIESRTINGHVYLSATDIIAALRAEAEDAAGNEPVTMLLGLADELDLATIAHVTNLPGDSGAEL